MNAPLANITRADLEPLWARLDIPVQTIAGALGVSRQAISYKAKALGLPPRTGNQRCNQLVDDDTFRDMWLAGVSTTDMARHFGYSHPSAIGKRRVLLRLPARTRNRGCGAGAWDQTIPIEQYFEDRLSARMAERAQDEQAARKR